MPAAVIIGPFATYKPKPSVPEKLPCIWRIYVSVLNMFLSCWSIRPLKKEQSASKPLAFIPLGTI